MQHVVTNSKWHINDVIKVSIFTFLNFLNLVLCNSIALLAMFSLMLKETAFIKLGVIKLTQ